MRENPVTLAERFFEEARAASETGRAIYLPAAAVIDIARDPLASARFKALARQVNDVDLLDIIESYLQSLQRSNRRRARSAERLSEAVRLGLGGGTAVTVVGAGVLAVVGGTILFPAAVIACGAGVVTTAVIGNGLFRQREHDAREAEDDIGRLLAYIKR
jgi:hypothetical protein